MSRQTIANPAEAFTAGDRIVHRRSLNLGTVEGDTSGAWNSVFVRWDNGDAGMVRAYDLRLADGYVVSTFRNHCGRTVTEQREWEQKCDRWQRADDLSRERDARAAQQAASACMFGFA